MLIFVSTSQKEYLLVKSFHIVFEAIIDALVGDNPLPDGMDKKQEDGKIVDHLFTAKSLIEGESSNTYYIGDSKYYKMGNELGKESVYKQYTYARNVIQWNLDIFNDGKVPPSGIKLRDDETEGYNIIPNFFISASMDEKYRYSIDGIKETDRKNNRYMSKQFQNRLFDRDTLLLFHYDVNFLFVLSLYARNNKDEQYQWKENIRSKFCTEIRNWLQQDFDFYAMRPLPTVNVKEYVETHFRQVLGKVYTPFSEENIFSLALDKKEEKDNEALLAELRKSFIVKGCSLGTDPHDVLPEESVYEYVKDAIPQKELVYRAENVFVLAVDRDSYDDYEHNRLSVEIPLDINNGMFKIDSIDYFMFIVENASEGYYRVANSRLKIKDGKLILALSLTDYQSFEFGFKEVAECDTKTIVSLQDLMNVRLRKVGNV